MMNKEEYAQRREWLYQQLNDDAVVIIVGNIAKTRSKNIKYHFRADNDLYYFTGFTEPNSVAVFRPEHKEPFAIFTRPNDAQAETSFGARAGLNGTIENFDANLAFDINDINNVLPTLLEERSDVYYLDEQEIYQSEIFSWVNKQRLTTGFDVVKQYRQILPLQPIVHNNRIVKSDHEVALIKAAVNASISGHKKVMRLCEVGMNELQLQAIFDREIANFGCREVSYPSIVASGNNACCLHYEDNNCNLDDGKLLLIDAGAEYENYCADITRTWPINGTFSEPQKAIYQIVLCALDSAISKVEPGLSWDVIYQTNIEVMAKGLIELGILKGSLEEVLKNKSYLQFTVHKTGHWLGMDVHDVGSYHDSNGHWRTLEPNMVFTIEPGIYIPENCLDVDKKWRGIAIRIEDDILVTKTGHENLSAAVPRTIKDIEQHMAP